MRSKGNLPNLIDPFKIIGCVNGRGVWIKAFGRGKAAIDHASTEPERLLLNPTHLMPD